MRRLSVEGLKGDKWGVERAAPAYHMVAVGAPATHACGGARRTTAAGGYTASKRSDRDPFKPVAHRRDDVARRRQKKPETTGSTRRSSAGRGEDEVRCSHAGAPRRACPKAPVSPNAGARRAGLTRAGLTRAGRWLCLCMDEGRRARLAASAVGMRTEGRRPVACIEKGQQAGGRRGT